MNGCSSWVTRRSGAWPEQALASDRAAFLHLRCRLDRLFCAEWRQAPGFTQGRITLCELFFAPTLFAMPAFSGGFFEGFLLRPVDDPSAIGASAAVSPSDVDEHEKTGSEHQGH